MDVSDYTVKQIILWHWSYQEVEKDSDQKENQGFSLDLLFPLRHWLNNFAIKDIKTAHRICGLIPAQCPFEREIKLRGKTILHIPPLCKLNPLYEEVIALRFRALCYLEKAGEDLSKYC